MIGCPFRYHLRTGMGFPWTEHGKRKCSPYLNDCSAAKTRVFSWINVGGTKKYRWRLILPPLMKRINHSYPSHQYHKWYQSIQLYYSLDRCTDLHRQAKYGTENFSESNASYCFQTWMRLIINLFPFILIARCFLFGSSSCALKYQVNFGFGEPIAGQSRVTVWLTMIDLCWRRVRFADWCSK